jgi:hypothetical protein
MLRYSVENLKAILKAVSHPKDKEVVIQVEGRELRIVDVSGQPEKVVLVVEAPEEAS